MTPRAAGSRPECGDACCKGRSCRTASRCKATRDSAVKRSCGIPTTRTLSARRRAASCTRWRSPMTAAARPPLATNIEPMMSCLMSFAKQSRIVDQNRMQRATQPAFYGPEWPCRARRKRFPVRCTRWLGCIQLPGARRSTWAVVAAIHLNTSRTTTMTRVRRCSTSCGRTRANSNTRGRMSGAKVIC